MCCSVGYNDGHTLLAIWDQASWLLLCSTETHIWKNPVSHFSPLPVLHKQNIGLRGWFLGFFFFCTFYSVNSVHVLMQRRAESCQPNQRISLGIMKSYLLHFAVYSYQHQVRGCISWSSGFAFSTKLSLGRTCALTCHTWCWSMKELVGSGKVTEIIVKMPKVKGRSFPAPKALWP